MRMLGAHGTWDELAAYSGSFQRQKLLYRRHDMEREVPIHHEDWSSSSDSEGPFDCCTPQSTTLKVEVHNLLWIRVPCPSFQLLHKVHRITEQADKE